VTLAWLASHPAWGMIALPLLARLYVRRKDLPRVPPDHRPPFLTKPELAVELVRWAVTWLGSLGKALWVAADGAYAKAAFLRPLRALGVRVVSRLRKDAALRSVPGPRRPGRRGRPQVYGERRIDLAKRAGQTRGWRVSVFDLYGKPTPKAYKTFLATWRPAGGLIRVVLVREGRGVVSEWGILPALAHSVQREANQGLPVLRDTAALGTTAFLSSRPISAGCRHRRWGARECQTICQRIAGNQGKTA
jgi:hypothetical protein